MKREIRMLTGLFIVFGVMLLAIVFGSQLDKLSFDLREQAAGKTYFVENNEEFVDALSKAANSDAIFLKVGSYTATSTDGFLIKNKNIRILGAGKDFVTVTGNNSSYIFTVNNAAVTFEGIKITGANKDGILIQNNNQKEVTIVDVELTSNSGAAISSDTKTVIRTSFINQNGKGIVTNNELILQNTVINNSSENAITITDTSVQDSTIQNSIFIGNKGTAIAIAGGKKHTIRNISALQNGSGIVETSTTTTTTITNSAIQDSLKEGISLKSTTSTAQFSNANGNKTADFTPADLKTKNSNSSVDSKFISESDLHLQTTSPLVNKGNTAEKDSNGTRIDIGAYGGSPRLSASNTAPAISSTPPRYIKPGQQYTYQVKATDPDNDELTYTILNQNAPKWLKQNGNSFTGTPTQSDIGFSGVILVVSDKKGHNVIHPISINIIPQNRTVTEQPTPTASPAPTQTPVNPVVPKITIVSPKLGTTFTNTSNEITWRLNEGAQVENFVIKYSDDKENFKTITTLKGTDRSYKWDIKDIPSGKYIIQVEAQDKGTPPVTIKEISEEFEIKNTPTTTPTAGTIEITKNSPPDNDNVTTRRPLIYVEFKPEADIDEAKTYLKINGESVKYKFTKSTIFYETDKDFAGTRTQVEAKIVTKAGAETTKRWIFSLPTTTNSANTTPEVTNEQTLFGINRTLGTILLVIAIALLLGLILYFAIKLLKTIRDERQGNLEAEFTEYYIPTDTNTTQTVTTTTTTTQPELVQDEPNFETEYLLQEHHNEPVTTVEEKKVVETTYATEPTYDAETTTSTQTTEYTVDTTDPAQKTTTEVATTTAQSDPYVEQLKKKYGITDTDIATYKSTEATSQTQITPPDPSQASEPPKGNRV